MNVVAESVGSESTLVVRSDGASLVGVSGHQLAYLPPESEVKAYGELGPYAIVSCGGRNGYVLRDCLQEKQPATMGAVAEAMRPEGDLTTPARPSWLRLLVLLAGLGGAAAILLSLV